jgi:glycosyltransferase involved in cell wall biosynthesis
MANVVVNVRTLRAHATGVQRYTQELVARLGRDVEQIAPSRSAHGVLGHLWEQTALPLQVGDRLLWSPGGSGPWSVSHQVVTIHDAAPLDHPEWFDGKFARWYSFLHPRLLARVERVITVSEFSRRRLAEYVPGAEERIAVIPLGKGASFRPLDEDVVRSLRLRLGLPSSYLLVVSSLQPRKNLPRLLSAWRRVRDRMPEDLILAVCGVRFEEIFGRVGFETLPDRVKLLGWVDDADLPALYAGAHCFVYPSLYEGFGLPPLEAMACGTPVVAANAGSLPEVVGDAAVLVEPKDIDSIARGLVSAVEDEGLRARLREAGFTRAEQFSWDRTAEATRELLLATHGDGRASQERLAKP